MRTMESGSRIQKGSVVSLKRKYSRSSIGKTFRTNEGYICEIVDGGSENGFATMKIENYIFEATVSHARTGQIKYPFSKSICNTGYIGIGGYSKKNDKLAYRKWVSMLHRCYDLEFQKSSTTYIGCSVDKRWHDFQVFARWFYKYYPKDGRYYELDKDIRVPGNKIYSSYTCMFVAAKLNTFMANTRSTNTSGYTGVDYHKYNKRWRASIYVNKKRITIGYFTNTEDAYSAYQEARLEQAEKLRAYYSFDYPRSILDNIK